MRSSLFQSTTVISLAANLLAIVIGQGIEPSAEFNDMLQVYQSVTLGALNTNQCTEGNIRVRRSWDVLSVEERSEYVSAVLCLHSKPPTADPTIAPGNRNRMDDFTFTHINSTMFVHGSGLFLPWHRYFVWKYEEVLRNECGYTGAQPYFDPPRWVNAIESSTAFDGSPTSLGGNGVYIPDRGDKIINIPSEPVVSIVAPPGSGGGCVKTGPFAEGLFNISLGPVTPGTPPVGDSSGTAYNPRCLTRDFLDPTTAQTLTWQNLTNTLMSEDIVVFRAALDANTGLHLNMHDTNGGDVMDFFTSPSDPAFYLLHTWFDRVWSIWQGQDLATRGEALDGTETFRNVPASNNVTVDTYMNMGVVDEEIRVGTVMSTVSGGPFCYRYD